jgi:hypothetical protein
MIKTLRITSVVAAISAVILFIFPVVFGGRSNEHIEGFLNSPSVIEKFNTAMGNQAKTSKSQSSPLVQQATAFASYLNPKPKDISATRDRGATTSLSLPVTPKFTVVAISYYEAQPELSLALIDEPGKGLSWVRQSSKVGHLVIEQVRDSLVVVKGGKETFELAVEERRQKSLLEGAFPVPKKASDQIGSKSTSTAPGRTITGVTRTGSSPPPQQSRTEKNRRLEEFADKLKEIQTSFKSDKTDSGRSAEEKAALMDKLISNFRSSRVGTEEAKKLGDLGKQLKNVRGDPNLSQPATSGGKNRSRPAQNKPVRK